MNNRTRNAVRRQLEALDCPHYTVIRRQWRKTSSYFIRDRQIMTQEAILSALKDLAHSNAQGCDIWLIPQPARDQPNVVLVDDLTAAAIRSMRSDGVIPTVVAETSPGNMQAWVRVPRDIRPIAASRALSQHYDGDLGAISNAVQPGRLAGFTNRKPVHRRRVGRYPFVLLRSARPDAPVLNLTSVLESEIQATGSVKQSGSESSHTPRPWGGRCAPKDAASPRSGGRDVSPSGQDWAMTCRMLAQGKTESAIKQALVASAESRHKRHPLQYAVRTLTRAATYMGKR